MAHLSQATYPDLFARHQASMMASLLHRLEVARANQDTRLIALLEREWQQLEAQTHAPWQALVARFQQLVQWVKGLASWQPHLQVWQFTDEMGHAWWGAFDPRTGQTVYTDSETELRLWIEQNYQEK